MTDKQTLLALAAKVEAAEGADRELDVAVFKAAGQGHIAEGWEHLYPLFTGSLDAAMALVPEGCWAEGAFGVNRGRSSIEVHAPMTYDALGSATAATPALALTAAALRARAEAMS